MKLIRCCSLEQPCDLRYSLQGHQSKSRCCNRPAGKECKGKMEMRETGAIKVKKEK